MKENQINFLHNFIHFTNVSSDWTEDKIVFDFSSSQVLMCNKFQKNHYTKKKLLCIILTRLFSIKVQRINIFSLSIR